MDDKDWRKYFKDGGKLIRVKSMARFRDGGTWAIETDEGSYYFDKECKFIYNNYPLLESCKVYNRLLIKYLLYVITLYIEREEETIKFNKIALKKIEDNAKE